MCKKLIFLITFVLLLAFTSAAWAIPFEEAAAIWNFHEDDPMADEMGEPFTNLSYYYYNYMEEVTGAETAEHWDGWAVPSYSCSWWSPMYYDDGAEIKTATISILVRVNLADVSGGDDGRIIITGLYDGSCDNADIPAYGIELAEGKPLFVVSAEESYERTEVTLDKELPAGTWCDIVGIFDSDKGTITVGLLDSASGSLLGKASAAVGFSALHYWDGCEMEVFCSPCGEFGTNEGDGHAEVLAVWQIVVPLEEVIEVSSPSPANEAEHVPCDVEQVCFYPPLGAQVWDPCNPDPNLLQGPFDFDVYFDTDPCVAEMAFVETILNHDTNDQVCSNVGATLPGLTYYWRVDITDQNGAGDPVFYEGPVYSFIKWGYAINPDPEDGAADMFPSVDPNWQNDGYAAEFDVFFGSDADDVDASEEGALVGDTQGFYDIPAGNEDQGIEPGALEFGTTYSWRVDECGIAGCVHGHVWSFSTSVCDLVEDFEAYSGANPIEDTWGAYNSTPPVPDFDNGASVFVYEGSMNMRYDVRWVGPQNGRNYALAQREFDPALNLLAQGSLSLSIEYRAQESGGGLEPPFEDDTLYMQLVDVCDVNAKVVYPGDVCDPCWATWYIALNEFTAEKPAIKLDQIKYVQIGADTDHTVGVTGSTYWDMMLRCAPYCRPSQTTYDRNGDCIVDDYELGLIIDNWLDYDEDYDIYPVIPYWSDLVLEYQFDQGLLDSSGNGNHGIPINNVSIHDGMMTLENINAWWTWEEPDMGEENYVKVGGDFNTVDVMSNSYTTMMKFRTHHDMTGLNDGEDDTWPVILWSMSSPSGHWCESEIVTLMNVCERMWYGAEGDVWGLVEDHGCLDGPAEDGPVADTEWHTVVTTYDADTGHHAMWIDGFGSGGGFASWDWQVDFDNAELLDPSRGWETLVGSSWGSYGHQEGTGSMTGDVDTFRIYDYAASAEEVMYLVTGSLDPVHVSIPIDDEDANYYTEGGFPNEQIDFRDYAVMANHWMEEELWPAY